MYYRQGSTVRPRTKKNQVIGPVIQVEASFGDVERLMKLVQDPYTKDLVLACIDKAGIEDGTPLTRGQLSQVRQLIAMKLGNRNKFLIPQ